MKKLMIAAAAAAMIGGVYADSTCAEPGTPGPCDSTSCAPQAWVYQWQFKGKTATGALIKGTTTTTSVSGGTCSEGSSSTVTTCGEAIRVPGSLAIVGYTYHCDVECYDFDASLLTPYKSQFYGTKPLKSEVEPYKVLGASFVKRVDVAHVIGKSASQYELAGQAEFDFGTATGSDISQKYTLTFAGFGSYDKKYKRVKSVSGNFAGLQNPPRYAKTICGTRCPPADFWDCCCLTYAGLPTEDSVAYGSWSVKYNSSATKKLENNRHWWVK